MLQKGGVLKCGPPLAGNIFLPPLVLQKASGYLAAGESGKTHDGSETGEGQNFASEREPWHECWGQAHG